MKTPTEYERGVMDAVRIVREVWQRGGSTQLSYAAREIVARLLADQGGVSGNQG